MGLHPIAIPFIVVSCFWGVVGIIIPWFIPKGPNRGIIRLMLVQTAFVCYVFWLLTYLMQLNPLIGPQLTNFTIYMMQREWGSYELPANTSHH